MNKIKLEKKSWEETEKAIMFKSIIIRINKENQHNVVEYSDNTTLE